MLFIWRWWNFIYSRTIQTHHSVVHYTFILFANWLCICFLWVLFLVCVCGSNIYLLPTFCFPISIYPSLCVKYTSILIRLIRIKFFWLSCITRRRLGLHSSSILSARKKNEYNLRLFSFGHLVFSVELTIFAYFVFIYAFDTLFFCLFGFFVFVWWTIRVFSGQNLLCPAARCISLIWQ